MVAAAWFGAIATFLLVVGAGLTVFYAKRAFEAQSQELCNLRDQVDDQLETNKELRSAAALQVAELTASLDGLRREAAEQRRAQASRVFLATNVPTTQGKFGLDALAAAVTTKTVARVRNASSHAFYRLEFTWRIGADALPGGGRFATLLPGQELRDERDTDPGAATLPFGADLTFTDAAGIRWLLTREGELRELAPEPESQ